MRTGGVRTGVHVEYVHAGTCGIRTGVHVEYVHAYMWSIYCTCVHVEYVHAHVQYVYIHVDKYVHREPIHLWYLTNIHSPLISLCIGVPVTNHLFSAVMCIHISEAFVVSLSTI